MIKRLILSLSSFVLVFWIHAQNIGINEDGSTPHSSAILDIKSNNKGMLVPRLSNSQMTMVSAPASGLLIYNTDTESFWFYGSSWSELNEDADSSPTNEIQTISRSGSTITLSNGGGSVTDNVIDGDSNSSNELQTLGRSGQYITLSNGGGFVYDDDQDDDWFLSGNNAYRTVGNVSIGTGPTAYRLAVIGSTYFSGVSNASRFTDVSNSGFYLDPGNTSISLNTAGELRGTRLVDINSPSYYVDPASTSGISMRALGDVYAGRFLDISSGVSYYMDLASTGISLYAPGQIFGSRFTDISGTHYVDPNSTSISASLAGTVIANTIAPTNLVNTPNLRLSSGASAGHILQSDATGNATWVDPSTLTSGVTQDVIHAENMNGVFWTHPSVNVTLSYVPATRMLTFSNNSGQSYWNISIFANSGPGNSTTCQDLNTVVDVGNGGTSSFQVSTCTTVRQGFTIMAADETGSTTGFRMDVVVYNDDLNAYVASW